MVVVRAVCMHVTVFLFFAIWVDNFGTATIKNVLLWPRLAPFHTPSSDVSYGSRPPQNNVY